MCLCGECGARGPEVRSVVRVYSVNPDPCAEENADVLRSWDARFDPVVT